MTAPEASPHQVLCDEILADARRQAERTARRARADADEIVAKARTEAEKEAREHLEAARTEAARRRDLLLATVPVDVTRLRARRLEERLQEIREAARERLRNEGGGDRRALAVALAAEAVGRMDGRRFVLELAEADSRAFGPTLADDVRRALRRDDLEVAVAAQPAPIAGGVVVRDAEGRQVWDNSLEARLERFWPVLRHQVAETVRAAAPMAGKEA